MKKFCLFARSLWKNLILKRKLRPYVAIVFDKQYRADINYMYKITRHCSGTKKALVRFGSICLGHRILYPRYANSLTKNMALPPIKVARDGEGYRVIDGNHRFYAMGFWTSPDDLVPVELLE